MAAMMRASVPKQRALSQGLMDRAIEFHGYGGPFMVMVLRMGLLALSLLDAPGWFDLNCKVSVPWKPPDSCIVDGIHVSAGCIMRKNNIEVEEKEPISAKFKKGDKCIEIVLKEDVLMETRKNLKDDNINKISNLMNFIIKAYDYVLFEINERE